MDALALVLIAGLCLLTAYFTFGRWLSRRVFQLDDNNPTPSVTEEDGADFVPTRKSIIFGHHFTSIAGTGPIVGPAIAVIWGWLPAILWVVLGSIFIGAVHDLGALVASLRNKGRSIGDIAGDILGPRARFIFLLILIVGLWIVLAVFGLVIATVLKQYPAAVFPVLFQIPIAVAIGVFIHRKGKSIVVPSVIALALMYASVVFGDATFGPTVGGLHAFNQWAAAQPIWIWTAFLLIYAYIASVIPVWTLLQPRDYINALQLITSLALIVLGLSAAAFFGGSSFDSGANATRPPLSIVAPLVNWQPAGAPPIFPLLFITIACGACSGFHCLVGSGTTSKQIHKERDARAVGYGSMLTEGFLATLVIAACAAGIGLGVTRQMNHDGGTTWIKGHWYRHSLVEIERTTLGESVLASTVLSVEAPDPTIVGDFSSPDVVEFSVYQSDGPNPDRVTNVNGSPFSIRFQLFQNEHSGELVPRIAHSRDPDGWLETANGRLRVVPDLESVRVEGRPAFTSQYSNWSSSQGLAATVGAFVQGSANFLAALGIPLSLAVALMAVMAASFAATTMDTACRLQRYVIQELSRTFLPKAPDICCKKCGYDLSASSPTNPSRERGAGSVPSPTSSSTPPHPLPLRERVVAQRPGEGSPNSSSSITCPECGRTNTPDDLNHPSLNHRARLSMASIFNPFKWLATTHGATIFAVLTAFLLAMWGPWPESQDVMIHLAAKATAHSAAIATPILDPSWWQHFQVWLANGGKGGLHLWPLFGATNQLLAGFAFVVIVAWLRFTKRPWHFAILPAIFMLAVPAAAMSWQAFIGNEQNPSWLAEQKWLLISVACATLALEAWLIIETMLHWKRRAPSSPSGEEVTTKS